MSRLGLRISHTSLGREGRRGRKNRVMDKERETQGKKMGREKGRVNKESRSTRFYHGEPMKKRNITPVEA